MRLFFYCAEKEGKAMSVTAGAIAKKGSGDIGKG